MSHIYSKEHQRLLKMPILEKPDYLDEKYNKTIDGKEYYLVGLQANDWKAYNNWLSSQPIIPEEHKEYFERYKDGEIVPESEFEIKVALQNVLDKDDIITWCVGSLMIEGQWKKIYVALPIIKEEQSKDDNVVSGNKSIEQELATISIYGRPLSTFLLSDQIQKIAEWLTSHYQLKKKA